MLAEQAADLVHKSHPIGDQPSANPMNCLDYQLFSGFDRNSPHGRTADGSHIALASFRSSSDISGAPATDPCMIMSLTTAFNRRLLSSRPSSNGANKGGTVAESGEDHDFHTYPSGVERLAAR